MGITDYNKKKQLDVDSVSGTPQVDKAQPLIVKSRIDTFEDGSKREESDFTGTVDGNSEVNGTFSMRFTRDNLRAGDTHNFPVDIQNQEIPLKASFKIDNDTGNSNDITELNANNASVSDIFKIRFEHGSGSVVENKSGTQLLSSWSPGTIYDIRVDFDFANNEMDITINGTTTSNIPFANSSSAVSNFGFFGDTESSGQTVNHFLDDHTYTGRETGNGDITVDFTNVNDAQDIAVYDQNGNLLDYEIESLDTTNETAVLWAYNSWVRDGTTQAQVAYGSNSANTDRQNVTATFPTSKGPEYEIVHHFQNENPALDATSNNRDEDAGVVTSRSTSTPINNGFEYDGTDDRIQIDIPDGLFGVNNISFMFWFKSSQTDRGVLQFAHQNNGFDNRQSIEINQQAQDKVGYDLADRSANRATVISSTTVNDGNWHLVAGTFDNGSVELFVDGVSEDTATFGSSSAPPSDFLPLGRFEQDSSPGDNQNTGGHYDGLMDDYVCAFTTFNADFVQAEFDANPTGGQVFFTQQSAESTTTAVSATVTDSLGFNESTVSTLSFTASDNLQVTESAAGTLSDTLSDNVQFSEQVLGTIQDDLTDQLGFTENTATALVSQVSDQLGFTEQTISNLTLQVLTSDNIQFTEQAEAQLLDTVTDQLSFQSTTQSAIAQSTSDQVTYSEAVSSALIDTLTDQVDFTEATSIEGTALLTLTDQVAFAENTESTLQDLESDQLGFNENVESRLEQVLEDGLGFSEQFEAELADTLSDSLDFSDRVAETVAATLTDSLSFAEKITASELLDLEITSPTKAVMTTPDRFAVMESITFKQNDLGDTLKATLKDDNGDINVSNASDVRLIANDRDGKNVLNESVTVTNGSAGEVEYSWSSGDFIEDAGIYRIEFEIEDGTGEVETVPNDGFVTVEIEEELAE